MLDVLIFILKQAANFIILLFDIDMGGISIGSFLACAAFGIPAIILIFNFLKAR